MPLHPWSEPGFWTLLSSFSSPLLGWQKQSFKSGASLNAAKVHCSNLVYSVDAGQSAETLITFVFQNTMLAFNSKSPPWDIEEQGVQRWLFCFCFHENARALCNICILHWDHSHAPFVQGLVSVTQDQRSSLSASSGTSCPHSLLICFIFHPLGVLGPCSVIWPVSTCHQMPCWMRWPQTR